MTQLSDIELNQMKPFIVLHRTTFYLNHLIAFIFEWYNFVFFRNFNFLLINKLLLTIYRWNICFQFWILYRTIAWVYSSFNASYEGLKALYSRRKLKYQIKLTLIIPHCHSKHFLCEKSKNIISSMKFCKWWLRFNQIKYSFRFCVRILREMMTKMRFNVNKPLQKARNSKYDIVAYQ